MQTPLETTLASLKASIDALETYHFRTYFSDTPQPMHIDSKDAFALWTETDAVTYKVPYDTTPAVIKEEEAGMFVLGNRFIATARELLYWGKTLNGRIRYDMGTIHASRPNALIATVSGKAWICLGSLKL